MKVKSLFRHRPASRPDPIGVGQVVKLIRPGRNGTCILAIDRPSFDLLLAAFRSGILGRYVELRAADRIRGVANGTRAEVVAAEAHARVVRVLDGPLAGFTGHVESRYIRPA